jgi:integrase
VNLAVAQQRANQIQLDILSNNYDPTLAKYRSAPGQVHDMGSVDLFERFIAWKSKGIQPRSLEKYHGLVTWMKEYYGDCPATSDAAEQFIEWLLENLAPSTTRERLLLLQSGWDWAIDRELVNFNPWKE